MAEYGLTRRLPEAFTQAKRAKKLAVLALLFVLLTAAAAGVTSVLMGPDWGSLWRGLLLGLLAGWLLAVFRQSAWRAALIALAVGLTYTLLFAGGLSVKTIAVFVEFARLVSRIVTSPKSAEIDLTPLAQLLQELFTSTGVVIERVRAWVAAFAAGEPTFDPVAAALVWSILVWIVAAWAGWVVEARKNALLAALPAILLNLGTLSYGQRTPSTLYLMLGSILILLATVQHDRREQEWDETGVAYPARKGRQIANAAIIVTTVLVLFSSIASSISIQRVMEWISVQRRPAAPQNSDLAKSLGILPGATSSPDVFNEVRSPGLPRDLLIGSGPELSKRIVMTVAVKDLPSLSQGRQSLPLYWRSFTYDVYTGYGWRSSETRQNNYQGNQPLQPDQAPYHILVEQTVRPIEGGGQAFFAAGEPVTVNLPSEAAWRSPGDLFGIQLDHAALYDAHSLVPVVDEQSLRSAGQKYPDWIRQRYLALPQEVPGRVKELAIELTASEPTPYDRARAIERYLRSFPYTLDLPRPTMDQDLVDFFLFDLKKGYCDYYASAMVVLARAAGVPARLAIGYASGTYNLNSRRFSITEADAHSWVEVYFPDIGWVPFEPTAARPSLGTSQGLALEAAPQMPSSTKTPGVDRTNPTPWGWLLLTGGLAWACVLGAAWAAFDWIWLRRLSRQEVVVEVYRRMRRYGVLLGVALESGDTPYEFAASLSDRFQDLARQGVGPATALRTVQEVNTITNGIVRASYRPASAQDQQDSYVLKQWEALRWRLRLIWVWNSWKLIKDRIQTGGRRLPGAHIKIRRGHQNGVGKGS